MLNIFIYSQHQKEIIKMIKDFYICLDNTALNYALKHFSNPFTRIMRCYTGLEVEMIVKTMESNKSKNFYTLRAMQNKILMAIIKNLKSWELFLKEQIKSNNLF